MLLATTEVLQDLDYYLPDNDSVRKLAEFFSIFGDISRLRILSALAISPLCVTDIAGILDMNQTTVSHQLKILRNLHAVDFQRRGKILYYKIINNKINDVLLLGVEYLGY